MEKLVRVERSVYRRYVLPRTLRRSADGQALAEFAILVPILLLLLVGVYDFSRVFTSQIAVEAAAREAADFGAFSSSKWAGDPTDPNSPRAGTEAAMLERACIASQNLEDYVGSGGTCTNPDVAITLIQPDGSPALDQDGLLITDCDNSDRSDGPCLVQVDMEYDFDLVIPFGVDLFGQRLGMPDQMSFSRRSIFAISDFVIDEEP
jgi:hypothetical protein